MKCSYPPCSQKVVRTADYAKSALCFRHSEMLGFLAWAMRTGGHNARESGLVVAERVPVKLERVS